MATRKGTTGRPPRLAHLVPGADRTLKRDRALRLSSEAVAISPASGQATLQPGMDRDILCLPNPEWLPHVLSVSGPIADVAAWRRAAAGPGVIPWVTDYDRLEEDWVHALLTPPPSERGISVEGARILAGQLRARIEQQDRQAAETKFGSLACPFDLHALVPVPSRILRLGPDDPAAIAWLWENWTTTWPLRGVEEVAPDRAMATLPQGHGSVRFRFWSADWAPWSALVAIRSRWPSISIHVSVRAVSE